MRKALWAIVGLIVVVLAALGGVLAFDAPVKPPLLASVSDPFATVDFSDLPAVRTYAARDGVKLGYRVYEGRGAQVVVLIHGSSDDGSGMHPLAKALRDAGTSVYVPVMRGHHNSGRSGDIDYAGQLEDDLADFVAVLRPLHPDAKWTLTGFSSGGCQSALEWDPLSASKRDPFERRVLPVALAPSELAGVAETERARACA